MYVVNVNVRVYAKLGGFSNLALLDMYKPELKPT